MANSTNELVGVGCGLKIYSENYGFLIPSSDRYKKKTPRFKKIEIFIEDKAPLLGRPTKVFLWFTVRLDPTRLKLL